ncbi:hypothetical protein Peur_019125 [Populus x canadensis]
MCFSFVVGDGGCHRWQGKEEGKKLSQTHPFSCVLVVACRGDDRHYSSTV